MIKKFLFAALLLAFANLASAQTLDFTLSASSSDGATVVPKLTWATTPAASSCTATGATGWVGSKGASGSLTLAAVTTSQAYVLACTWPGVNKATIVWTKPTTNTDGSAYSNPNGYHIQYGPSAANLSTSVYLTEAQTATPSWVSPNLAAGTWFFGVRAVNTLGLESVISNVASKTLTADTNQSRTLALAITFPNAPTLTIE